MPKSRIICILLILLAGCGPKKISLRGDQKVEAKDFFAAFGAIKLPFVAADTNIHKIADTTEIGYNVFAEFVPDSILKKFTGKDTDKYLINPVGKIEKQDELYILATFSRNKKTILSAFLFDKKFHFLSVLELLNSRKEDGYSHSVNINSEPTFIISREKTTTANQYFYTKNGYAYSKNSAGFILLMNDSNEDPDKINEIIDPIDTLPHKNKFSGNYAQDKRDFIAVRDGQNAGSYYFFIHFEKDDGQCIGELKGEMKISGSNKAVYKENGDACMITFTFSQHSVYVKEDGNCGNHRGIKCYFDDSYEKRNEPKKSVHKK